MYNCDLKTRFIDQNSSSENIRAACRHFFDAFEKYEKGWGADLCTRTAADLQPIINDITGISTRSKQLRIVILRKYIKWCVDNGVEEAILDGIKVVPQSNAAKTRRQMVSSPFHLQSYLDKICDPEYVCGTDNAYRCYFWLAFGGMNEEDILKVKSSNVDLLNMVVRYNNQNYPIYKEAIPAFNNCIKLKQFSYNNPSSDKRLYRDRAEGEQLIRTTKQLTSARTLRVELSRRAKKNIDLGKTDISLSYYRAKMSGIFYRAYEQERAGMLVSFSDEVIRAITRGDTRRGRPLKGAEYIDYKSTIKRQIEQDYENWKKAFN